MERLSNAQSSRRNVDTSRVGKVPANDRLRFLELASALTLGYFFARRTKEAFSAQATDIEVYGRLNPEESCHWFAESPYGKLEKIINDGVFPELSSNDREFARMFHESARGLRDVFDSLKSIVKQKAVRDGFGYRLVVVDPEIDEAEFALAVSVMPKLVHAMLDLAYTHLDANSSDRRERLRHTRLLVRFLERMLLDFAVFSRKTSGDDFEKLEI